MMQKITYGEDHVTREAKGNHFTTEMRSYKFLEN
jgi:hypothetical protein